MSEHVMSEWRVAVSGLADKLSRGLGEDESLGLIIRGLSRQTKDYAVRLALLDAAKFQIRRETVSCESAAQTTDDVVSDEPFELYLGKYPHGFVNARGRKAKKSAMYHGCECPKCREFSDMLVRLDAADEERFSALCLRVGSMIDEHVSSLKMEWTQELLASNFALRDGTLVTWGLATTDQHRERVQIFSQNAVANIEGAARHSAAISEIENAGVTCLNDLTLLSGKAA